MTAAKIQFISPDKAFTVSCTSDFLGDVLPYSVVVQGDIASADAAMLHAKGKWQAFNGVISFGDPAVIDTEARRPYGKGDCKVYCYSVEADRAAFMRLVGGREVLFLLMQYPA